MLEERCALVNLVENCSSIGELDNKLNELESKTMEFMVDVNDNGTITIGVLHSKAQLSTVDNDGRVETIVTYIYEPWHWYNIMPREGFVFDD